jgi:hypothetical protein
MPKGSNPKLKTVKDEPLCRLELKSATEHGKRHAEVMQVDVVQVDHSDSHQPNLPSHISHCVSQLTMGTFVTTTLAPG